MAAMLVLLSAGLLLVRWAVLGPDIVGPRGASAWKVTLVAAGELNGPDAVLTLTAPPDFRHQHVFDERAQSKELLQRASKGTDPERRELVFRPANVTGKQAFRLAYSFRCLMGMRRPSTAMTRETRRADAKPVNGADLKPSPRIESDSREISASARELTQEGLAPMDQVHAFFDFVSHLEDEPMFGEEGALECLQRRSGDAGGKSRLLIALCRNRGIPARLLSGLILTADRPLGLHHWVEAWINDHWVPMCPAYGHFGIRLVPQNYLVLHVGDEEFLRGRGLQFQSGFTAQDLHDATRPDQDAAAPSALRTFFQRWSLYSLRPNEQGLVKFLLLLPPAALIVSLCRILIGVPTFGTFSPALLGLAFLDLKALPWGLFLFVSLVLVGWGLRRGLDRFQLLMVPRLSILLTLIVLVLLVMLSLSSHYGLGASQYLAIYPLVILTHLVERFWTMEAEDGTVASFKTLLGTFGVSVVVSLCLAPDIITTQMFRYPEILGVVLAGLFLLGRYTGYRLTELYRFRDLIEEEPA